MCVTFLHVDNFTHHSGDIVHFSSSRITLLLERVAYPFFLLKFLYLSYVDVSVSLSCTSILSKYVAHFEELASTNLDSFFLS